MNINQNFNKNRYEWAADELRKNTSNASKTILFDIGARNGILKDFLKNITLTYKGFDIDPLTPEIKFWNLETAYPYGEEQADVVTLLEIVEHLNNPWICIKNISNVLKPGGYLLLSTPNPHWSRARLKFFLTGFLNCFTQNDLEVNHHVFTPWPHVVEKLLSENGFEIIECNTLDGQTRWFEKPISIFFPLQFIARTFRIFIERLDRRSCGMSYSIIAKRLNDKKK